jgi:hypothetical protein
MVNAGASRAVFPAPAAAGRPPWNQSKIRQKSRFILLAFTLSVLIPCPKINE